MRMSKTHDMHVPGVDWRHLGEPRGTGLDCIGSSPASPPVLFSGVARGFLAAPGLLFAFEFFRCFLWMLTALCVFFGLRDEICGESVAAGGPLRPRFLLDLGLCGGASIRSCGGGRWVSLCSCSEGCWASLCSCSVGRWASLCSCSEGHWASLCSCSGGRRASLCSCSEGRWASLCSGVLFSCCCVSHQSPGGFLCRLAVCVASV